MGRQRYIPIFVLFTFFTIFTLIFSGNTLAQEKPEFSNPDASDTHPYGVDYLIPEYFTGDKASILNKGLDSYNNRFIRPGNTNEGTTCWAYNSEDYENLYNQSMSRFGLTGGNEALFETQLLNQCIEDSKLIEYEVFIGPDYERSSDTYSYFKVKTSKLDSLVGTEREDEIFLSFNGWTTLGGYGHHNVDTRNQSSYIVAVRQVFTDNQTFKNTESSDDVFIYKNRYLEHTNLTDDLWHNDLPLASSGEHNRYRGYFHLYYGWDYEREGYLDGTLDGSDIETPYGTVLRLLAENDGVDVNVRYRTTDNNTYRHIPLHQDSLHYTYTNGGYYEGTHGNTVTYEALNTESVREALAQYYDNTEFTTTNDSFRRVLPETPIYGWGKNFTYNDVGFSTQINLTELFNDFSETGVYKLYLVNRVNDMIVATELHVPQDVMMWANEHIKTGALGFLGSAYGNQIEVDYGTLRGLNRTPNVGDVFNINTIQSANYGPSYFEIRYNNASQLLSQQDTRPILHERGALLWFNPYHGELGSNNEVSWNYSTIPSISHANNEGYVIEHTGHNEILIDAEGNRLSERYTLNTYGYWEDIHVESQDIGDVSMNDDYVWLPVSIDDSTNVSQLESIFEQDTHTLDDFPISLTAQHVPNIGSGERVFNIEYLPFKEQGFRYTFIDTDTGDVLYSAQDEHTRGGELTSWLNGEIEAINLSDYVVNEDNAPIDTFLNVSRFAEGHFEGVEVGYERVPNQTVDVYNWNTQTLEAVSLDDIVDEGVYYTMSTEQLKGITGNHVVTWDIEYQEMPEVTIHFEDEKGNTLREPLTTYASRYNTFDALDVYENNTWFNIDRIEVKGKTYQRVSKPLSLEVTEDTKVTIEYEAVQEVYTNTFYSMLQQSKMAPANTYELRFWRASDDFLPPFEITINQGQTLNEADFCQKSPHQHIYNTIQSYGLTGHGCDLIVVKRSSHILPPRYGELEEYYVRDKFHDPSTYLKTYSTETTDFNNVFLHRFNPGYNKSFKFRYIDVETGEVIYESETEGHYIEKILSGEITEYTLNHESASSRLATGISYGTGNIRNTYNHNGDEYVITPNQTFEMYSLGGVPRVDNLEFRSNGRLNHYNTIPYFLKDDLDIEWNILFSKVHRVGIRHSFNANEGVVPDGHNHGYRILFPITYFGVPHDTRVNENTYCVNGTADHLYNQLRDYGWVENDCLLRVVPRENMTHKYKKDGHPVEYAIRRLTWSGNNSTVTKDGHFFPNYYVGYNKKWNYRFIDSVTGAVLHESDYIGGYLEDMVSGKKSSLTQMEYDYSRSLPFRETNKLTDIYNTYTHTNGINYTVVPNQSFDMYASGDENARIVSKRIQFLTNGRVSHAPLRPAFTPDNQNITWNILYEPEPRTVNFRPRIISSQNVVRVGHTRPNSEIKPIISFDVPYGSTIDESTYCVDGTANHLRTTLNNMGAVTGDCHLTLISADAHGMYAYTLDGHPVKYAVRRNAEVISNYTSVGTRNMNFYVGYNKKFKYRYIDSVTGEVIYESDVAGNILEDLVNGRKEPLTLNELSYVRNLQHLQLPTDIRNTYTRNGVNYTAVPNQSFPVYENNNDNARIVNKRLEWYSNGNINPSSLRPAFTPDNLDITWNILFEPEKRTFGIRHSMGPNEGAVPDGHTAGNRRLFNIDYFDVPHGTVINENTYCVDGSANHLYSKLRSYGAVMDDCLLTVVARDDMQLKYRIDGRPVEYAVRANVGSNISKRVLSDDFLFLNYFNGYNKKFKFRFIDSVTGAVIHESDEFYNYLDDMVKGKKNRLTQSEIDFSLNLNYDRLRSTGIRNTFTHNGLEYTVVPNQRFDMYNASNDSDAPIVNRALQWLSNGSISHNPLRPAFTPDNLDITWNILYEPENHDVTLKFVDKEGNDIHEPFKFKVPSGYLFRPQTFCKTDYPEFESVIADFVPVRPSNGTFEECIGSYTNIQPEKNVPNDEQRTVYKLVSNNNTGNLVIRQNTTRTYVFEEAEFVTQAIHRFSSRTSDYPDNERPMAVDGSSNDIIFSTSEVTYKPRVEKDVSSNATRYTARTTKWDLCDWLSHEYNELLKYNNHVQSCQEGYIIPSENFTTQYTYKGHSVDYVGISGGGVTTGIGTSFPSNRGGGIPRTLRESQRYTTHDITQHRIVYNNTFQYRLIDVTTGEIINESQLFGNFVKDKLEGKPLNTHRTFDALVGNYITSPNMVQENVNIPEVLDVDHELNPTNVSYRVVQGQTFEQYTSTNKHNFTTSEQPLRFSLQGYVPSVRPAHGRDSEPVVWNILFEPENPNITLKFVDEEGTHLHPSVTFEVERGYVYNLGHICDRFPEILDLLPEGYMNVERCGFSHSEDYHVINIGDGTQDDWYKLVHSDVTYRDRVYEDTTYTYTYGPALHDLYIALIGLPQIPGRGGSYLGSVVLEELPHLYEFNPHTFCYDSEFSHYQEMLMVESDTQSCLGRDHVLLSEVGIGASELDGTLPHTRYIRVHNPPVLSSTETNLSVTSNYIDDDIHPVVRNRDYSYYYEKFYLAGEVSHQFAPDEDVTPIGHNEDTLILPTERFKQTTKMLPETYLNSVNNEPLFSYSINDFCTDDTTYSDTKSNYLDTLHTMSHGNMAEDCLPTILDMSLAPFKYMKDGYEVQYAVPVNQTYHPPHIGLYTAKVTDNQLYHVAYDKRFKYRFVDVETGEVIYESEEQNGILDEVLSGELEPKDVVNSKWTEVTKLNSDYDITVPELMAPSHDLNTTDESYELLEGQTFPQYSTSSTNDNLEVHDLPLAHRFSHDDSTRLVRPAHQPDDTAVVWNILYEPVKHDVTLEFVNEEGTAIHHDVTFEVEHGTYLRLDEFCVEGTDYEYLKDLLPEGIDSGHASYCIAPASYTILAGGEEYGNTPYSLYDLISPRYVKDLNQEINSDTTITFVHREKLLDYTIDYRFMSSVTFNANDIQPVGHSNTWVRPTQTFPVRFTDVVNSDTFCVDGLANHLYDDVHRYGKISGDCRLELITPDTGLPHYTYQGNTIDYAVRDTLTLGGRWYTLPNKDIISLDTVNFYNIGYNKVFQYRYIDATTGEVLYESEATGNVLEDYLSGKKATLTSSERRTATLLNFGRAVLRIEETLPENSTFNTTSVSYKIVPNQTVDVFTSLNVNDDTVGKTPIRAGEHAQYGIAYTPDNEPVVWNILYEPDSYYSGSTVDPVVHIAPNVAPDISLDDVEFDIETRDNEGIGWRLTDEDILARANVLIDESNLAGVRNAVITTRLTDSPSEITDSDTLTVFGTVHDGENESDLGTAYRYDNTRDKADNLTYQLYISFDYTNAYITSGDETEVFWGEDYGDTVEVVNDENGETEEIVTLGKMEIRIDLDVDPPYKYELDAPEIEDDAYVEHTHELLIGREITNLTFGNGEDYGEGQAVNGVVGERFGNTITRTYDDYTHYTVIEEPEDGIISYHITTSHPSVTPYFETIEIMPTYLDTLATQGAIQVNERMLYTSAHGNDLPDDYYAHYDIHYIDENLMDVLDMTAEDKFRVGMLYDADTESFTLDRTFGLSTKYGIQIVTDALEPDTDVDAIKTELADALGVALNLIGLDATEDSLLEGLDYTVSRYFMPIDKDTYLLGMATTDSVELSDLGLNDVYVNYDKTFTFEQYLMGNVNDNPVYAAQPSVPEQIEYMTTQRYQAAEMSALIETITTRLDKFNLFRTIDDGALLEYLEE